MTSPPISVKVSTCVDCGTTIIGERLRCPACHDKHAAGLVVTGNSDEDRTLPRDLTDRPLTIWQALLGWFVLAQILAAGVILMMLAGKGC